jgi:hypothetical protein
MRIGLRFPFRFDIDRLHGDLARILPQDWSAHYNERDYGGAWRGVALRSHSGSGGDLHAMAGGGDFADTALLDRCAYFREVLSAFRCPLKSVRLLSLAPQSFIREHSDHALGYEDGEIRIHVPIQTNPGVEFYVAGERLLLEEGASYFVNVNLPHRVNNRGAADRVHLVIDAEVNEWVCALFRQGDAEGWHIPRSPLPPRSVDDFRKLALEHPELQTPLRHIEDRSQFVAAVLTLGKELGFDFHEGDVHAAFRTAVSTAGNPSMRGWTPTGVSFPDGQPIAEWLWTGDARFTAPFFTGSMQECARLPFAAFFRRSAPLDLAPDFEAMAPSGFIFHMSRCGSTLVSRMLASLSRVKVISEAPPLDDVLRANCLQWLRWMVAALGQRTAASTHYVLKLDAWHIRSLPLIRQAFPDTPWIFLYRDPLEVAVSQLRSPGLLGAPGLMDPAVLGMEPQDAGLDREQWCVRVLASLLNSARAFACDPMGLFVNYRELPGAVCERIAPHFGISLNREEREQLEETSRYDAKRPYFAYEDDSEGKRTEAGARLRELTREWIEPIGIL